MSASLFKGVSLLLAATMGPSVAAADNLHLIDETSDFALYRSGHPKNEAEMKRLCDLDIAEVLVLSGNSTEHEEPLARACLSPPRVVYDHKQTIRCPLTSEFLDAFDQWIARAKERGLSVAFRCNCGCHRTGRLAAYYQIKYQGLTTSDALAVMKKRGKWMWWPPLWKKLEAQVVALGNHVRGEECELRAKRARYCVKNDGHETTRKCEAAQRSTPFGESTDSPPGSALEPR